MNVLPALHTQYVLAEVTNSRWCENWEVVRGEFMFMAVYMALFDANLDAIKKKKKKTRVTFWQIKQDHEYCMGTNLFSPRMLIAFEQYVSFWSQYICPSPLPSKSLFNRMQTVDVTLATAVMWTFIKGCFLTSQAIAKTHSSKQKT